MNPNDPNVAAVETVAHALGHLRERLVFVGGSTTGILITDLARPPVRATKDVDLIAEVASRTRYYELQNQLRELGFSEMPESDVICRWRLRELIIDVMPTVEEILGFSNRWYSEAVVNAEHVVLPKGRKILVASAPYFLATKLEAFAGRGGGDFVASHDIEDLIAVVDGRPELVQEVLSSDEQLRSYLSEEIEGLLQDMSFSDSLPGHLPPDGASQARTEVIFRRLRDIAGL